MRQRFAEMLSFIIQFLKFFVISKNPPRQPIGWMMRLGKGKRVAVHVLSKSQNQDVVISFQRKIVPEDKYDGKLLPVTADEILPGGRKRLVSVRVSLESVEALIPLLQQSLKDAKDQEIIDKGVDIIGALVFASANNE